MVINDCVSMYKVIRDLLSLNIVYLFLLFILTSQDCKLHEDSNYNQFISCSVQS